MLPPAPPRVNTYAAPAHLELVEHLYDEAVKKQNDEAKTVLRKQNYSTKNPATGQLNNIRDTGGAQPLAANGGKYPEKKTLKPYRELTDGEKEKIRAFQKKATFPITDNADKQTANMLKICTKCGFYGHNEPKCRLPDGATSRFNVCLLVDSKQDGGSGNG